MNEHRKAHVHAPKYSYTHAYVHIHMFACMHMQIHQNISIFTFLQENHSIKASALYEIEFRESDVSPGRTEVKEGKFV